MNTWSTLHLQRWITGAGWIVVLVGLLVLAVLPRTHAADTNPVVTDVLSTTFFVNPISGSDANPGSLSASFKTLGKALMVVRSGDTIQLAQGSYGRSTNGEIFGSSGLYVPSDVTIIGTRASPNNHGTFLYAEAGDSIALEFAGDVAVKDLELDGFSTAFKASSGTQVLSDLNFSLPDLSLNLSGSAQTKLNNSSIFLAGGQRFAFTSEQAQLAIDGSTFRRQPGNPGSALFEAAGTSRVAIESSPIEDVCGPVLQLEGSSSGRLTATTIKRTDPLNCNGVQESIRGLESSTLHMDTNSELFADGISSVIGISWQSTGLLALNNSAIVSHGTGIILSANARLIIENGSRLNFNRVGLITNGSGAGVTITINDSRFVRNGTGIDAACFKIRNSILEFNDTAVKIRGSTVDLGTSTDPGLNTIRFNTATGVQFANRSLSATVPAHGNTWNPLVQGADVIGRYSPQIAASPATGYNFIVLTLNQGLQL